MARIGLVTAFGALAALTAPAALAGDAAQFNAIGFSEDARYFAFEEYGIQDGSGFAYSSIYVVDVLEDRWVGGGPFRYRADSEEITLGFARTQSMATARNAINRYDIIEPATPVAINADGEIDAAIETLVFGAPGYGLAAPAEQQTLSLDTFPIEGVGDCPTYTEEPVLGFALSLETEGGTGEIYRDEAIPSTRGCPLAYRIYGVVAPVDWDWNAKPIVAVISVYSLGFEGPDRRFVVVPVPVSP